MQGIFQGPQHKEIRLVDSTGMPQTSSIIKPLLVDDGEDSL